MRRHGILVFIVNYVDMLSYSFFETRHHKNLFSASEHLLLRLYKNSMLLESSYISLHIHTG